MQLEFSRYSAPIHWLIRGHMTSNNEIVPNAMSTERCENYDVKREAVHYYREMLTAVTRDQSVQFKVFCCCGWNLSAFFKICFSFVSLYNKSLDHWSIRKRRYFSHRISMFPETNIEIFGKQNSLSPGDQSLSVKYLPCSLVYIPRYSHWRTLENDFHINPTFLLLNCFEYEI